MHPLQCEIWLGPDCPTSKRTQRTAFSCGSWGWKRERGLKTDKGEGITRICHHLFLLFKSLVWVTLCGPWSTMRLRQKDPCIITWAIGGTCAIQVSTVRDSDSQLTLGAVCLQMKRQYAHVLCSAAVLNNVKQGSHGSVVGRRTEAALAGQPRTTECILTSRTEDERSHSRAEVLMGNTRRPSSSLSSSFSSASSLTPPPPSFSVFDIMCWCWSPRLSWDPPPGRNAV